MDNKTPHCQQNGDTGLQGMLTDVMNELIDEVTLGLCFDIHRASKIGTLFLGDTDPKSQREYEIVEKLGVDVFGQVATKKQFECVCPNCQRNLAASRFAPHLEKCMGMGRNSSRIASRRQARIAKESETSSRVATTGKGDSDDHDSPDDDNDVDWSYNVDKKVKKLKKEKILTHSPRRNKHNKFRNGNHLAGDNSSDRSGTPEPTIPSYELMTVEERKQLLLQTCGVISEHTKKMCTRSHRCPQHTDEQRRQVRVFLLGHANVEDDVHIDIDSLDDVDNQSLRESLQWEVNSSASSPTDSTSTNNSTSGAKKRPPSKSNSSKNSNSKKKKGSKHTTSSVTNSHGGSGNSISSSSMYDFE
ncbi:ataxin-7-like protein 3 [Mizuhopecten yessoensis]|uniref:SAGA-associated factor 11 homolog n=1 Tax=Mizuhopecten yessoensis TaxID=6573 RepID=A0A210PRG7_MIZYE|nr:ataxin-7-like protein 3 [Mizuhopecten yessoensis]OWF39080.1 Ataxin-7-like protein 3 [Mizuhopecten yessoensis]